MRFLVYYGPGGLPEEEEAADVAELLASVDGKPYALSYWEPGKGWLMADELIEEATDGEGV